MTTDRVLSGGHYRLGEPVTPAVHAARDAWEDRHVLAVALAPDGGEGPPVPDALTRVARDVRRLASAQSPGLARALDVAVDSERGLWLVQERPAGARPLAQAADRGPVPVDRLVRHADVLARALGEAHAARLVHGRIGADVVLVGPSEGTDDTHGAADGIWLLGAASGYRPDDRAGAEDADTRALAAVLAEVPVAAGERGERLQAVLTAVADGTDPDGGDVPAPGTLGAALRRALGELVPASTPVRGAAPRRTEVIATAAAPDAWSPPAVSRDPAAPERAPVTALAPADRPTARIGAPPSAPPAALPASLPPRAPGGPPGSGGPSRGPGSAGAGPARSAGAPPPAGSAPRRSRHTGLVLVAAAVAVLLVGGVVAVVATLLPGDGSGDTPGTPTDRVVPTAIGDPRTVDPCGLVDPRALAAFGTARLVPDLGAPASCVVDIAVPPPGNVAVVATLEPASAAVSAQGEDRVGDVVVRRAAPQPGTCSRTVVTTEGLQVAVDADATDGSTVDLCAVADAATGSTVRALQGGPLSRRTGADPPSALTAVDTCGLLTPEDLAAVPGLAASRVEPGVAGWSCRWGAGPQASVADAVVAVGVERRREFTRTEDVAGRPAAVTPRPGSCDATLAQRSLTAADGTPRVELLAVTVYGPRPPDELCARARSLARATVPRLPPP